MARILIVEDDPMVRELVRTTLGFGDHHVTEVDNGRDALARADSADLVLMDLGLEGEPQGPELCRRLRARATAPRVIVVSGAGDDEARSTIAAGAEHFLRKPFSPLELIDKIESVLGGRSS